MRRQGNRSVQEFRRAFERIGTVQYRPTRKANHGRTAGRIRSSCRHRGAGMKMPLELGEFTILLVDDSEETIRIVSEMLAPTGTRVSGVPGLHRCSALHRLVHLDAATVDLQMPGMGGTELCLWLLVRYPHVRAILKSGNLTGDNNARARWLGCAGVCA